MTDAEKALIEINGRLGGMEKGIGNIEKCLFGNGQRGLAQRFETLHEQHVACIERHKEESQTKNKIFDRKMTVILSIVTVIVPVVWEALKHLFGGLL